MSLFATTIFLFLRYLYVFYNNAVGYNFKSCCLQFINEKKYNKLVSIYKKTNIHDIINPYFNTTIFILNVFILIYIYNKNKSRIFAILK